MNVFEVYDKSVIQSIEMKFSCFNNSTLSGLLLSDYLNKLRNSKKPKTCKMKGAEFWKAAMDSFE
jgi:hypothetical protein